MFTEQQSTRNIRRGFLLSLLMLLLDLKTLEMEENTALGMRNTMYYVDKASSRAPVITYFFFFFFY